MSRPSCGHVQTNVRSCPDHRAFMSRFSCVHQTEKITYWGAVQILEAEDREGSKTPQIQIFEVFLSKREVLDTSKPIGRPFFSAEEQNLSRSLSTNDENKVNL